MVLEPLEGLDIEKEEIESVTDYELKVASESIDYETTADDVTDLEEKFNLFLAEVVRTRRREGKLIYLAGAINLILVSVIVDTGALNRYISTRAARIAG
jgi:hypothetical protein